MLKLVVDIDLGGVNIESRLNVTNAKEKNSTKKQIKLVLLSSAIIVVLLIISLVKINNVGINNVNIGRSAFYSSIISVNYVLSFISVITCCIYYYIYKRDEFFLMTLGYISFAVEYLCENVIIGEFKDISDVIGLLILTSIFRLILILLVIKEKSKLSICINSKKQLSIIITILLTIALILFEIYFKYIKSENININLILNINIVIIGYYCIIMAKFSIKVIRQSEFIWAIIVASINMFVLKKIYLIANLFYKNNNLYEICKLFTLAGFCILITGLFIEIISKVKENENLKEELEVFYTLTEQSPTNRVLVYNEENEIIYANALMRETELVKSRDINTYSNIENLSGANNRYGKLSKEINERIIELREKIIQDGYFRDVFVLEDGIIIKLYVKEVKLSKEKKRTIASFRDITEEYNRQRELKINENKFITMTESIKDIIATVDVDGIITYVNSMVEEIVGYKKEELIGEKYTLLLDESEEKTYNFISSNYKDSAFRGHKVICKDKRVIHMESVVSKIFTGNNELVGHAIVSRDLGYRKEFESLKVKYDEIKAYDKIRNEFFANLSHEVRTPINIIYSCFQLLNNQKENGPESLALYYDKYEKTIKQNCFRMLRLVNNLIDITKIDSGFIKMRFGNYDIINLVEEITLSVVPYVEAKKIDIMFDTEIEELEIKCDADEIERVMLNILSNAIKFNEVNGIIFVNISVDEDWVNISVKDTGIGIEKDLRTLIFERFMQTDKSLNRENEGSGIGLALVKSLVELHNGKVYLNDNVESGSEFIVKLPNVLCDVVDYDVKNISGNNSKPTEEKISIELSDIYDL